MTDASKTLIAHSSTAPVDGLVEGGYRGRLAQAINGQRAKPGQCQVTLAQFDTEYEVLYPPTDIASVPEFVVHPRGGTALLDATGKLITDVGEALSALPEGQRPDKVIFLIMTDGMENRSHQWTWGAVKALITQQREVYNWEFIFLGADIDAVEVGARMGMDRGNAMTFDKRSYMSNRAAYRMVSEKIGRRRLASAGPLGFSDEERDEAMGRGEQPTAK